MTYPDPNLGELQLDRPVYGNGWMEMVFWVVFVGSVGLVALDEGRPTFGGQPAGAPSGLSPQAVSGEAAHQAQGVRP